MSIHLYLKYFSHVPQQHILCDTHIHCVSVPLQELKETEELDIQLKVFNENKEEDSIELSHRLDDIRAEMEYPFVLIYR